MVYKSSLVFGLSLKSRIGPIFVKKVSRARRTLRDFESSIGGKALAGALAGVVD